MPSGRKPTPRSAWFAPRCIKAVRFRVSLDGAAPGQDHGIDVDAQGYGVVNAQRLFQLIRQKAEIRDRRFEIRFLDSGVQAYAFTFG